MQPASPALLESLAPLRRGSRTLQSNVRARLLTGIMIDIGGSAG